MRIFWRGVLFPDLGTQRNPTVSDGADWVLKGVSRRRQARKVGTAHAEGRKALRELVGADPAATLCRRGAKRRLSSWQAASTIRRNL